MPFFLHVENKDIDILCIYIFTKKEEGTGVTQGQKESIPIRPLVFITRKASPDDDMDCLSKSLTAAGSALAVHDRGPPGVTASRHRLTLRFALPLHTVDYVRHQLLLLLPLLLPV